MRVLLVPQMLIKLCFAVSLALYAQLESISNEFHSKSSYNCTKRNHYDFFRPFFRGFFLRWLFDEIARIIPDYSPSGGAVMIK